MWQYNWIERKWLCKHIKKVRKKNFFKKLYGPFLWMGFNCLKAWATSRGSLLFTTKFPEIPGTEAAKPLFQ